jgi:hypothetical protein
MAHTAAHNSEHGKSPSSNAPASASAEPKWGTRVNLSSNAIAGVAAGFSSSVITHPLDVVKTRFQVEIKNIKKDAASTGVPANGVCCCFVQPHWHTVFMRKSLC